MKPKKPRPLRPHDERLSHPCIPRDGDRVLCLGQSGSGKSTIAARSLVRDVIDDGRKALIFDPTEDVATYLTRGGAASKPIASELVAFVRSRGEAREALGGGTLAQWFRRSPVRVLVLSGKRMKLAAAAALWCSLALDRERDGWVLFADEANLIFPLSLSMKHDAFQLLTLVRNRRQRLYGTCNYPATLAPQLRANAEHACVFSLTNTHQVEACEWFGSAEWFEGALELEKFHYLYRGRGARAPLPVFSAVEDPLPW